MKTLVLLFALSFYLLANPTHSMSNPIRLPTAGKAVGSESPVLDSEGEEVRPGQAYYINSISWGAAGRDVKLGWLDSTSKCPSDVILTPRPSFFNTGDPVTITPADPAATAIMTATYQSITFSVATNKLCVNNVSWAVRYDSRSGQYILTAGEFVSNLSNQFKIEFVPTFDAYKITYCMFGTDKCYDVGSYYDTTSSTERLALSEFPFLFYFKKASTV